MASEQELMRAAYAALLRGDTRERDRIMAQIKEQRRQQFRHPQATPSIKTVDTLVQDADGVYRVK